MSLPLWRQWQKSNSRFSRRARRRDRDRPALRPLERCEDRILLATVVGLTNANALARFDSATPGTIVSGPTPITNLQGGATETAIGIDFRPADGQLYAITNEAGVGRLYTIDTATGAANFRGTLTADPADLDNPFTTLAGTSFGIDFNPVPDRLRVTSDADQNLRINVGTALVTTDADLNPGTPNVVGSAYTNSFAGATATTLYDIDSVADTLVIQDPPNDGTLVSGPGLGVGDISDAVGFDIRFSGGTNQALASLVVGGVQSLYSIDLSAQTATLIGAIGGAPLTGLAIVPAGFANTTLVGTTATFNGNLDDDTIVFDQSGGLLRHNRFSAGDPGFNSDFDFAPNIPGDQTLGATDPAVTIIVNGGGGNDQVTLDFAGGNPIPVNGFAFDGGTGSDLLVLQRSSGDFIADTETYEPTQGFPGSGTITLDGSVITFSNLDPVVDTVPAVNFTFTAPAGSTAINVLDGPVANGFPTTQIDDAGTGTFELIDIANKTNVTINTGTGVQAIVLNNPTAAAGVAILTINAGAANDQVTAIATSPGVTTTVNTLGGDDNVRVTGAGLPDGTTTFLDGGPGVDALVYDGGPVVITPGPLPGQTTITRAGSGTVIFQNFEQFNVSNVATPVFITAAPARTVFEDQPLVDVVVAQFTADPAGSPDQYSTTISWGDGTLPSAGTVAQDPVNPALYYVSGSHTYASPGAFTITVTVRDRGRTFTTVVNGVSTTTTTPAAAPVTAAGATITVADAPLQAEGATVAAVEGRPTGPVTVATFLDTGGAEALVNYTVTINWGDGVTTVGPVTITPIGTSPAGTTFVVQASHTYADTGVFPITVTIASAGGSSAVASGQAVVADAALTATCVPFAATEGRPLTEVVVATFTDAGGPEPIGAYSALIFWGDGTPATVGLITFDPATQTFRVAGSHTYDESGTFTLSVQITEAGGSTVTVACPVTVADVPIALAGQLDPESDTGVSNTDNITNDNTPSFVGTSEPGSIVTLTERGVVLGRGVTDGSGVWRITTSPLADGTHTLVATAVDRSGVTGATTTLTPVVVDTIGPRVTDLVFDPRSGRVVLNFQDDRSGLDQFRLRDGSNYLFNGRSFIPNQPRRFRSTSLAVAAPGSPTAEQAVTLIINGGRSIRGGTYTITARAGGLQDVAGNALDGEFFGSFPSGNNRPGGDFVAIVDTVHNIVFSPKPEASFATPLSTPGRRGESFLIRPGQGLTPSGRQQAATKLRKAGARPIARVASSTQSLRRLQGAKKGLALD